MKRIILKATNQKDGKKKGGGVFYTILFVAIITVGTTSYIMSTRNRAVKELEKTKPMQSTSVISADTSLKPIEVPEEYKTDMKEPVSEALWQSDDVIEVEDDEAVEVTNKALPKVTSMLSPVDGEIMKPHSETELSYSKTMEDWRLHRGVDISASIGTTVKAAADGEVSECYTDTAYGVTVVIDHGNGLFSKYCNLASDKMVEIGQTVEKGTAIGVVGDTAEFEVADKAHLHFEVIKDGNGANPEEYFK